MRQNQNSFERLCISSKVKFWLLKCSRVGLGACALMWKELKWEDISKLKNSYDENGKLDLARSNDPYLFDMDENGFPVFSDKNISFVMGMIANDSQYDQADREETESIFRGMLDNENEERSEDIRRAVCEVDAANSTHLTAVGNLKIDKLMIDFGLADTPDGNFLKSKKIEEEMGKKGIAGGLLFTAEEISKIEPSELKRQLREGSPELVYRIAHAAERHVNDEAERYTKKDKDTHETFSEEKWARIERYRKVKKNNFSFATKFCHWACVYIDDMEDNFCIYDNVVGGVLPYYVSLYAPNELNKCYEFKRGTSKVEEYKEGVEGYRRYRELYDSLKVGINKWRRDNNQKGDIGYGEIDQLIWYHFKGKKGRRRTEEALKRVTDRYLGSMSSSA